MENVSGKIAKAPQEGLSTPPGTSAASRRNAASLRKAAIRPDLLTADDSAHMTADDFDVVTGAIDHQIEQAQVRRAARARALRGVPTKAPKAISDARWAELLDLAHTAGRTGAPFMSTLPLHEIRAFTTEQVDKLLEAVLNG